MLSIDADLEYDPEDISLLLPPLLDGCTNAFFGVRGFDVELPVRCRARPTADGKKLQANDGLRVLATLVRCRLTPS
ncbi:MAG TPA: hypothetical protein VFF79_03575 [Conexibacter sp.]|jgi:hypothetical protein|nr:hypothetical protein [Conexibacter sp.]